VTKCEPGARNPSSSRAGWSSKPIIPAKDLAVAEGIAKKIMRARAVQDRMWGREVDDTKNDPWRWSTYISHCAIRWMRDPHNWTREDTDDFYDAMIETAAICAAAAESVLRQRNANGRTFYEPAPGNGK